MNFISATQIQKGINYCYLVVSNQIYQLDEFYQANWLRFKYAAQKGWTIERNYMNNETILVRDCTR